MEPSNGYIAERVQETKACLHTIHLSYGKRFSDILLYPEK
jgi:hypothetical protein